MTELAEGAEALAAELGFAICGGDLSRSHELFVAVTATGHAGDERELARREGARPGDRLGVTGTLGGAGAGLLLLERKLGGLDFQLGEALLARQLRPRPRIEAGLALARAGVHGDDRRERRDRLGLRAARRAKRRADRGPSRLPLEEGVAAVAERRRSTRSSWPRPPARTTSSCSRRRTARPLTSRPRPSRASPGHLDRTDSRGRRRQLLGEDGSSGASAAGITWPPARVPLGELDDDRNRHLLGIDRVGVAGRVAVSDDVA